MSQTLAAVFAINDQYSTAMRKILSSQDSFEKKQRQLDKATENFSKRTANLKNDATTAGVGMNSLAGKMAGLVSVTYLAKKGLDAMFAAINTSALQKVQETTFQALLNSEKIGTQLYAYVGKYAKASALGREDIAKGVTSFLTVTRDMQQIEQLIKMTERLYAKDPTQGADGAVFALKEVLAGDVISLRNRYGITGVSGEKVRALADAGDTAGQLAYIDEALNRFGATQAVVDKNFNGLLTQTNIFTSNLKTAIGEQATPVMENLAQVMIRLNENFEAGKYQPFINLMVNGMSAIGNGIAWVAENAHILIPVVGGLVIGIIAYNTAMAVANIVTASMAVTTQALVGNWIAVGATVAAVAATVGMVSMAMKDIGDGSISPSLDTSDLGKNLATTTIPTEITNTSPISVKGEVDIEKESLQYLMDMAGTKFMAKFSTATMAPQVNMYGTVIEKTANLDEVQGYLVESLVQSTEIAAEGDY